MKYQLAACAVMVVLCLVVVVGCQSRQTPISPDVQTTAQEQVQSSRYLWGYYNCEVDPGGGSITAVPSRSTSFHIDANQPLNKSLGLTFAIAPGSNPPAGYFLIDVSIKHPFAGNPQFTGFDAHGIFLSTSSVVAGGLRIPGPNDAQLLNADGWSRWWNPSEFTNPGLMGYVPGLYHKHAGGPPNSVINPYKLFGDGLGSTVDTSFYTTKSLTDGYGRAIFRSASTNTRRYVVQFPVSGGPVVLFDYAIDASWAAPSVSPPVNLPADFPIEANAPEAFILKPTITKNTLAASEDGGIGLGNLSLSLELWDWQGWKAGSYVDQLGIIRLLSPNIAFGSLDVKLTQVGNHAVVTIDTTCVPSATGKVPVIIEVPAPGTLWKQNWQTAPAGEVAAYTRIDVDVTSLNCGADNNEVCDEAAAVDLESSTVNSLCQPLDQSDHYVFVVPTGSVMEGKITLDNLGLNDNDLFLYDGCPGNVIDVSLNAGTGAETIDVANLESGFYYVAVLLGAEAGIDIQPYVLTLDIAKPNDSCTIDNDNDSTVASSMELADSHTGSVCNGGDVRDWLKISVPAGKVAGGSIYLDNQSTGDINLRVYETYPGPPTYWGTSSGNVDENVMIPALGPGEHFMEIYSQGSNPAGDRAYQLDTNLEASDYSCASGDGNDSYMTADPISFTQEVSGTVCFPADPDWFVLIVPTGKSVTGPITLSGNLTFDNDLYLYSDPAGAPVESSAKAGIDDEVINLNKLEEGTYYIKAAAHPLLGGGDQDYTLTTALIAESAGNYDFKIHAHVIRKTDGTSPCASDAKVQADVAWADEFYSQYDGSYTVTEISYIDNTAWQAASTYEMQTCNAMYRDTKGPINVYYVNNFTNIEAAAYAIMDCRYLYQTHNFTYIVMSDYGTDSALAHELGHATGIFQDTYLLDYYSCWELYDAFCPNSPNQSFCDEADRSWGNLMYWGVSGWDDPSDYWLSDYHWDTPALPIESQTENWSYFHEHYPNNF